MDGDVNLPDASSKSFWLQGSAWQFPIMQKNGSRQLSLLYKTAPLRSRRAFVRQNDLFIVFPFAFGDGPRIFEHMGVHTLKLLDTKTFSSGAVALIYQSANK
jgi:hypothetical protein